MPRASWKGFLRLSLVSCPIYLSPAATRTKSIRLHQVWNPRDRRGAPIGDEEEDEQPSQPAARSFNEDFDDTPREPPAPTRVSLRPHDPHTGEEIEREEVAKGYEYERGQFVTFTPAELKALDVESSKIIDLETFVPRAEVDPVYFNTPYYVYPDGPIAVETFRVIGAAMAEAGEVGIGRVTLSRRERPVMVNRAARAWCSSPYGHPRRLERPLSKTATRKSTPKWWRSPRRSSSAAAAASIPPRSGTVTRKRCAS